MKSNQQPDEMAVLTSALCEGYLTPAQLEQLNSLLVSDPSARVKFLRYMVAEASYDRLLGGSAVSIDPQRFAGAGDAPEEDLRAPLDASDATASASLDDAWILPGIPWSEEPREELEIAPAMPAPRSSDASPNRAWRRLRLGPASNVVRWAVAAGILLAMGLVASLIAERTNRPVITVVNSVAAQWGGTKSFSPGDKLPSGTLDLESGVAKLNLPGGVAVVVEGPAKFEVNSPAGISLFAGKIVATVPHEVSGFTVTTPGGSVVDLGTQFGVSALADGTSHVEVFQGRVEARPHSAVEGAKPLSAGQSADLSPTAVSINSAGATAQHFVFDVGAGALSIDVADLVAGGDGTTHRRDGIIDPQTGASGPMALTGEIATDSIYHRVPSLPVIDGCFIPNGAAGPVQVDSAGHLCVLPSTDGKTWDRIFSGNHVPVPGTAPVPTVVGNVDYSQPDHCFLYLHANVGLTFDLAAIRRLHPELTLTQFHAMVGNVFPKTFRTPKSGDIFFIVDGVVRSQRRFQHQESFPADVPLSDPDRFLSIVATDAGIGNNGQDVMLGDPAFETHAGQ